MNGGFLERLRRVFSRGGARLKAFFGGAQPPPPAEPAPPAIQPERPPASEPPRGGANQAPVRATATRRWPRLWNVGLDFGTAFTKCIVRDLAAQEAFVVPLLGKECLLPSEVCYGNGSLWLPSHTKDRTESKRATYLKMVLAEISGAEPAGPWAAEFRRQSGRPDQTALNASVEELTTYYLACVIHRARAFILQKTPDFDETLGDKLMVNMSVPVAHAQDSSVVSAFAHCLRCACSLARDASFNDLPAERVRGLLQNCAKEMPPDTGCYVYPEVSANFQSYIKSRAGKDGLYLFMDVGAGTVDLSVFIFYTEPSNDRPISYVSAGVLPLGSSQIEIRAAQKLHQQANASPQVGTALHSETEIRLTDLQDLVRRVKEGHKAPDGSVALEVHLAQAALAEEVFEQAAPTLGEAKAKIRRRQWRELKLIIGGGGAETPLYRQAVNRWCQKFYDFQPEPRPIPLPTDLRWPSSIPEPQHEHLFRRFSVAYGLSFDRANLEDHRFPSEVLPLDPPSEPLPELPQAPTKDEC